MRQLDIKQRIDEAQTRALLAVNAELLHLYWDIGQLIDQRQRKEGWGAGIIPRLAVDLHNDLPEIKGFSERNLKRMLAFYRAYPAIGPKVPQPVALLADPEPVMEYGASIVDEELLWSIPWGHHAILIEKIKDLPTRLWYMRHTVEQGWSRNMLALMIDSHIHTRQGLATSNFSARLPAPQSDLVQQALKDPYLFDFLTLEEPLSTSVNSKPT